MDSVRAWRDSRVVVELRIAATTASWLRRSAFGVEGGQPVLPPLLVFMRTYPRWRHRHHKDRRQSRGWPGNERVERGLRSATPPGNGRARHQVALNAKMPFAGEDHGQSTRRGGDDLVVTEAAPGWITIAAPLRRPRRGRRGTDRRVGAAGAALGRRRLLARFPASTRLCWPQRCRRPGRCDEHYGFRLHVPAQPPRHLGVAPLASVAAAGDDAPVVRVARSGGAAARGSPADLAVVAALGPSPALRESACSCVAW